MQQKLNPLLTLAQIRANRPCATGWTTLLAGLGYADGNYDPERYVSLGDVATINDAADALWCVSALDWSAANVRHAVITGVVLPAMTRTAIHTANKRVQARVAAVRKWCAGVDTVDLKSTRNGALIVRRAAYSAAVASTNAEREYQRRDITANFPPVALLKKRGIR